MIRFHPNIVAINTSDCYDAAPAGLHYLDVNDPRVIAVMLDTKCRAPRAATIVSSIINRLRRFVRR